MADDVVYVDFADGLKRMMNNAKLYVKLLAKFRDGTGIGALEAAFGEGNLEKTQSEVHTLKGLAANLSLAALAEQCLSLETEAKNGKLSRPKLETVKAVFDATMREIDRIVTENGQ